MTIPQILLLSVLGIYVVGLLYLFVVDCVGGIKV